MSQINLKTKYNQEGPYGTIEEKTLYCKHNNTVDIVTYYDENGKQLFSVNDTIDNNLFEAIVKLWSTKDIGENVERMNKKDKEKIKF